MRFIMRGRSVAGFALLALSMACIERSGDAPAGTQSAPGPPVTVAALESLPHWQLGAAPLTVIRASETDDRYDLSNTPDIALLSDGRVVIASNSATIRMFSSAGTFLMEIGRRGSGPGEYRQIVRVTSISGDTLAILDNELGRVAFLTPGGTFVRSARVPIGFAQSLGGFATNGVLIGTASDRRPRREDDSYRPELSVVAIDLATGRFDTLATLRGAWRNRTGTLPLSPRPALAVAGRHIAITSGDSFAVDLMEGRQRRTSIRVDLPLRRVTDEDRASIRSAQVAAGADQAAYERHVANARQSTVTHHGQIARLLVDSAGRVWVLPSFPLAQGLEREWIVFDTSGRPRARLPERPQGARVAGVGTDYVILDRFHQDSRVSIEVWPLVTR